MWDAGFAKLAKLWIVSGHECWFENSCLWGYWTDVVALIHIVFNIVPTMPWARISSKVYTAHRFFLHSPLPKPNECIHCSGSCWDMDVSTQFRWAASSSSGNSWSDLNLNGDCLHLQNSLSICSSLCWIFWLFSVVLICSLNRNQ